MLPNSGITVIGHARSAGHLYHFADSLFSLWCVYIDAYTGHGIIKRSINQGITWYQTDDVGLVDEITMRGQYVAYRQGYKVSIYDVDEGFVIHQKSYQSNDHNSYPSSPIPIPELGGYALKPPRSLTAFGDINHQIHHIKDGAVIGGWGRDGLQALWGTQNNKIHSPDPTVDKIFYVWRWYDVFFEVIRYDVLGHSVGGFLTDYHPHPNSRDPIPLPMETPVRGTQYEGFMNARNTTQGCSAQTTSSSPAFFLPADNWQRGFNTAPLHIPDLGAPRRQDGLYTFPVASTGGGHMYDDISSRAGAVGVCGGAQTFGLLEPGGGLALCRSAGPGNYYGRKFLGALPGSVARSRIWMPFTNGIFGMGLIGAFGGITPERTQTLLWVWDKEPDEIPSRTRVIDGRLEEDPDRIPVTAETDSRSFVRW